MIFMNNICMHLFFFCIFFIYKIAVEYIACINISRIKCIRKLNKITIILQNNINLQYHSELIVISSFIFCKDIKLCTKKAKVLIFAFSIFIGYSLCNCFSYMWFFHELMEIHELLTHQLSEISESFIWLSRDSMIIQNSYYRLP